MAETVSAYAFAPIGGGEPAQGLGFRLFCIVSDCIDWFLGCFVIFRCHPELVSGSCDVKKMEDNLCIKI